MWLVVNMVNVKQLLKAQKNNVKIAFQKEVIHIAQDTNKIACNQIIFYCRLKDILNFL